MTQSTTPQHASEYSPREHFAFSNFTAAQLYEICLSIENADYDHQKDLGALEDRNKQLEVDLRSASVELQQYAEQIEKLRKEKARLTSDLVEATRRP